MLPISLFHIVEVRPRFAWTPIKVRQMMLVCRLWEIISTIQQRIAVTQLVELKAICTAPLLSCQPRMSRRGSVPLAVSHPPAFLVHV